MTIANDHSDRSLMETFGDYMMARDYKSWPEKYAAVCQQLRDLFAGEDIKPMLLLDYDEGPEAYQIDESGYVHRVHKDLGWIDPEEFQFIESGTASSLPNS